MARFRLTLFVGYLLACSAAFMPAAGRAAEEEQGATPSTAVNRRKLEHIIIPKLECRDATVREVIDFLEKKSVEQDTDSPEGDRGLNIVLKLEAASGTGTPAVPAIPGPGAGAAAPENPAERRITVSLTNVSLLEALRYVTALANLKLKIDPDRVYIVPSKATAGEIATKEWKIPRDLIPGVPPDPAKAVAGSAEPDKRNVDRESPKNWLIANGVTFEGAATAVYIVRSSRLIVRNTQDQLDLVDTIVSSATNPPTSVEIECRLVEIEREKMKDVTLESVLEEFNNPDMKKAFLDDMAVTNAGSPEIFSALSGGTHSGSSPVSGVFTDPQFQLVLRMLVQKKGADVLTSPRVTVRSGRPAVIRFVRQFSSPTEDVPPQVRSLIPHEKVSAAAGQAASTTSVAVGNMAVTLEVNPVVGSDGYTIDLNMTAQVTESDDFVSYTSPFRWMDPSFGPAGRIVTPQSTPTAVFSTRKKQTNVSVYDCSTAMYGDLLNGEAAAHDFLATKIPVDGRSGRTTDVHPAKRRLILFVSAFLHNASNGPLGADNEKEEVITTDQSKPPAKELPLMSR